MSEPPACSVFDPRQDVIESMVSRSPATPFGARRVNAQNESSIITSRRSRKLGTAFRSPVTTLSPPLRGQTLPTCAFASTLRFRCEPVRSRAPSLDSVSKPKIGRIPHSAPVARTDTPALSQCRPISAPLRVVFKPSGSKRSTGYITTSSPCPTSDYFLLPTALSFDVHCGSTLKTRLRPARLIVP